MKIAWCSDLHLNFIGKNDVINFANKLRDHDSDCVVISGDIAEAPSLQPILDLLDGEKKIWFILGNHDFYHSDFETVRNSCSLRKNSNVRWIQQEGSIKLTETACLIGHDSFYDARFGYPNLGFSLNDFDLIKDLKFDRFTNLIDRLHQLGDEAADFIDDAITEAAKTYSEIIIVTHVPPFSECSKYGTEPSPIYSLPFFSCKAIGETLLNAKERYPNHKITVLCGHTHFEAELHIDNLHILVADAEYYSPAIYKTIIV
jgi:3',5'-cyclic AMP phosphodiesterase CpdA